jgi:hypothetical protein
VEGDQQAPPNAKPPSRPSEHRKAGLDALEADDDSAMPPSRARLIFNESCLNHWLPVSDPRAKNAVLE